MKKLTERILNQFNTIQIAVNLEALIQQMNTVKQNIIIIKNLLKVSVDKNLTLLFLIIFRYKNMCF